MGGQRCPQALGRGALSCFEAKSGLDQAKKFANHDTVRKVLEIAELVLSSEGAATKKASRDSPVSVVAAALRLSVGAALEQLWSSAHE